MATTEAVAVRTHVPSVVRRNTILLAIVQGIAWLTIQSLVLLGADTAFRITNDKAWSGVPLTVFGVASALTGPNAGRLMDRFGRRPPLMAGQAVLGLGTIMAALSAFYGSLPGFLFASIVMGIGTGASVLSRSAAADMYPVARRGEGISFILMGGAVAAIGGPQLLFIVTNSARSVGADPLVVPWAVVFLFTVAGVVSMLLLRPDPRDIAANLANYYPAEEPRAPAVQAPSRATPVILRQFPVIVAIAATGLVQAGMAMFMATAPLDIKLHGHGDAVYGILTGHFFGMLGLSLFIGRLADRLGRRLIILGGAVIFMIGAITTPIFHNPLYIGASLFLVGLGWSLCFVSGNTVLADMARPLERGRVLGANDMVVGLTSAAATLLGGVLLATGGFLMVGAVSIVLVLVPLFLAVRLREAEPGHYGTAPA